MLTSIIRSLPSLRSFRAVTGIREWSSEIEEYVASVAQPQTGPAVSTVAGQAVNYTPYAERLEQLLNTPLQLGASSDEATQAEKDFELELYRMHNSSMAMAGRMIQAKVLQVDKKKILLDTGVKVAKIALSDITPDCIISRAPSAKRRGAREVRPGDVVQVYLEYEETPEGDMLVSGQQAAVQRRKQAVWKELEERAKTGKTVKGRVLNQLSGGYSVGVAGLICFLPTTRCGPGMAKRIGDLQEFKIMKMSPTKNNVILADPRLAPGAHFKRPSAPKVVRPVVQEAQKLAETIEK